MRYSFNIFWRYSGLFLTLSHYQLIHPLNLSTELEIFSSIFFSLDIELNHLYTDSLRSLVYCNELSVSFESHDERQLFLSQKLANNNNFSARSVILYLPSPSILGFWVSNALLILQLFKTKNKKIWQWLFFFYIVECIVEYRY